jgi:hypothetical protein
MRQNSTIQVAGLGATNGTQVTASIDCAGYSFARILCLGNTNAGLHTTTTNNKLEESDDNATWVAVDAAAAGTAYTPSSATAATTLAKLVYDVDLRGRKRYLKVTFSTAATTSPSIVADLGLPADGKTTAAEIGTAHLAAL